MSSTVSIPQPNEPKIKYTSPVTPEDGEAFDVWLRNWHAEHNNLTDKTPDPHKGWGDKQKGTG